VREIVARLPAQGVVQLELEVDLRGQMGEALLVLPGRGRLAPALPEQHLVVDQVEHRLGVASQGGVPGQVVLHRQPLAALPV
jgi:hypothetical protein